MSKKNKIEDFEEVGSDNGTNEALEMEETRTVSEVETSPEETQLIEQLKEDVAKEKDKFLRLFAEFENYKKRTSKERIELFRTAGQEVLVSLLPILDDFERALKELSKGDDKTLFMGIELINNKLKETLKNKGLQEVDANAGDTFDADAHEAITQIPAPDKKLKGKIIDVIEKGYKLGDKIIRHPKVVVGK